MLNSIAAQMRISTKAGGRSRQKGPKIDIPLISIERKTEKRKVSPEKSRNNLPDISQSQVCNQNPYSEMAVPHKKSKERNSFIAVSQKSQEEIIEK